jgi:hypothetical protein
MTATHEKFSRYEYDDVIYEAGRTCETCKIPK